MGDWLAFVLVETALVEVDQGQTLAVGTARDSRIIGACQWSRNGTWSTDARAQIVTAEILEDLLERAEEERLVSDNGSTDTSAGLFAAKILKGFAVRSVGGQSLQPLVMEQAPVHVVCTGFGDDVDHATRRAAELGAGAG